MSRPAAFGEFGSPSALPTPYQVFIIPLSADSRTLYTQPDGTFIRQTVKREARISPGQLIKNKATNLLRAKGLTTTRHTIASIDTLDGTAYYIFAWLGANLPAPAKLVGHNTVEFLPSLEDRLQTRLCMQLPAGLIPLPDNLANHGHPK